MPTIVALVGARDARGEIERALRDVGDVRVAESAESAVRQAAAGELAAVVTDLRAGANAVPHPSPDDDPPDAEPAPSLASLVVSLAARAPAVPLLIYDRMNRPGVHDLLGALAPGLRVHCVFRPFEPLRPAVEQSLASPLLPTVAPVLVQRLVPLAPPELHVFLTIAAFKAPTRRRLEQLAPWSGVTARTVDRRFARIGWSAPAAVLQAMRALDAVSLIAEGGLSVQRVARLRGLSSDSAVTRLCARYCGLLPSTLHESGGFPAALEYAVGGIVGGEWGSTKRR